MVDIVLKLTKPEVEVSSIPNTVNGAVLFRIFAPSTAKITVADSSNTVIGTMTIPSGFVEIMEKRSTDLVYASPAILCTPLAYK